jgi:hypothetical protein
MLMRAQPMAETDGERHTTRPWCRFRSNSNDNRAAAAPGAGSIDMAAGTVKWFNITEGDGFIQPTDSSRMCSCISAP